MKKLFKSILVIATAISAVGCCCSEKQCGEDCSKEETVKEVIMTRRSIRDYKEEVPGASAIACGNYLDMNLPMANYLADKFLREVLDNISEERLVYPD